LLRWIGFIKQEIQAAFLPAKLPEKLGLPESPATVDPHERRFRASKDSPKLFELDQTIDESHKDSYDYPYR